MILTPRMCLIWDESTWKAAPVVKPEMSMSERNTLICPSCSRPNAICGDAYFRNTHAWFSKSSSSPKIINRKRVLRNTGTIGRNIPFVKTHILGTRMLGEAGADRTPSVGTHVWENKRLHSDAFLKRHHVVRRSSRISSYSTNQQFLSPSTQPRQYLKSPVVPSGRLQCPARPWVVKTTHTVAPTNRGRCMQMFELVYSHGTAFVLLFKPASVYPYSPFYSTK